jgi:hypothetical protein
VKWAASRGVRSPSASACGVIFMQQRYAAAQRSRKAPRITSCTHVC